MRNSSESSREWGMGVEGSELDCCAMSAGRLAAARLMFGRSCGCRAIRAVVWPLLLPLPPRPLAPSPGRLPPQVTGGRTPSAIGAMCGPWICGPCCGDPCAEATVGVVCAGVALGRCGYDVDREETKGGARVEMDDEASENGRRVCSEVDA